MASMTTGVVRVFPSTAIRPSASRSIHVFATTRMESLNSITSEPASRNSSSASSRSSGVTAPCGSWMVIRTPGPVAGTVPAMICICSIRCLVSSSAALAPAAPETSPSRVVVSSLTSDSRRRVSAERLSNSWIRSVRRRLE